MSELEARVDAIDGKLQGLAHSSLNTGVGAIGYRSDNYKDSDHLEWIRIDLEQTCLVDQIILVPTVWRDLKQGFVADAFPSAFRILAGSEGDTEGHVIVEYDSGLSPLVSIAPVIFPIDPIEVSWVRLEATRLSTRARDGRYILQLAEMMVYEGPQNQALRKPVTNSPNRFFSNAWNPMWLVDGILPYVMNAAQGQKSLPMISRVGIGDNAQISIDLEGDYPLSRLRLHAVGQGDTMPQAYPGDFGIPRQFILEGAHQSDFSDATVLLDVSFTDVFQTGPIMEWAFSETYCRYVRLIALEPYMFKSVNTSGTRIGFAEIELLTDSGNVAVGKPVTTDIRLSSERENAVALTDGNNLYGNILPVRTWLEQLAYRRDLEAERPIIVAELALRYMKQKMYLRWLAWIAVLLAGGIAFSVFYSRMARQRQEVRIRERISANLHDELGANLHAIGLLGDLAKDAVDSREDLIDTVDRIRALTMRTGKAASNCANLLEADGFCEDLVTEMRQDVAHLLGDLQHSFEVEGEQLLMQIRRRTRLDLYLFYKEALTNIIRHSGATRVSTRLIADANFIRLTVTDNGDGLNESVPKALARRARMLRADFNVDQPEVGSGTRINLRIKNRKFGFL
ncbi:ATP-binding protein [Lentimonas sp. CC21]|uniref:ATP-binding protein n=1 Tax=Lentimonas sp. CC21 TaxID=2676098 RepID=UPI001A7F0BE5|nr:ATP-binding protein [Lentimonas sp. CC21]